MKVSITEGRRRLAELSERLAAGQELTEPYAAALAVQARRVASGHPTPQARMAASALMVHGSSLGISSVAVVSGRGGPPVMASRIAGGSEYGSSLYPQFGPRRRAPGAWLGAAAARPDASTTASAEDALDELVRDSVR